MRISVNCGHTQMGPGYGAVCGSYKESQITRAVGNEVIRLLKEKGHTVHNSTVNYALTQNKYLKRVVQMANDKDVDLFISIHCNASLRHLAHGTEVYTYNGRQLPVAVSIGKRMAKLGFKNRGVKSGNHLYVVKNTKAPAILAELFFVDNAEDQSRYKKVGYKEIAKAIADAIN